MYECSNTAILLLLYHHHQCYTRKGIPKTHRTSTGNWHCDLKELPEPMCRVQNKTTSALTT